MWIPPSENRKIDSTAVVSKSHSIEKRSESDPIGARLRPAEFFQVRLVDIISSSISVSKTFFS